MNPQHFVDVGLAGGDFAPVEKQRPFIRLMDSILQVKATNPSADTADPETEIDQLVYQLYNLTQKKSRQ